LEAFCKTDPCLQTNNGVLKKTSTESVLDAEAVANEDLFFVPKERAKKKRKLTWKLREFTGVPSEGERTKHEGWSDEGMVAFEKHVLATRKDAEDNKHAAWEKACWEVMVQLDHSKKDNHEPSQQARHEPNLSVVCEGF
jgi:hypothetical protein